MVNPLQPPESVEQAVSILYSDGFFRGIGYSSLQLYSNTMSEKTDPHCLFQPEAIASYWPGGIKGSDHHLATLTSDTLGNKHIAETRERILSLKLSKTAMRRWNDHIVQMHAVNPRPERIKDEDILDVCAISNAPFALISLGRVTRHKFAKPGSHLGFLYFPNALKSPAFALETLQQAQRDTIEEEKF